VAQRAGAGGRQTDTLVRQNNRTSIHNYDTKSTIVIASISNDDKPKAFVGACAWQPRISLCFFLYYKKKVSRTGWTS
jgi:hypothetical protein